MYAEVGMSKQKYFSKSKIVLTGTNVFGGTSQSWARNSLSKAAPIRFHELSSSSGSGGSSSDGGEDLRGLFRGRESSETLIKC